MKNLFKLILFLSVLFALVGSQTAQAHVKITFDLKGNFVGPGNAVGGLWIRGVPNSDVRFDFNVGDNAQTILTSARDQLAARGFNVTPVVLDPNGRASFDVLALPAGGDPPERGGGIGWVFDAGAIDRPNGLSVRNEVVNPQPLEELFLNIKKLIETIGNAVGGILGLNVATFVRDEFENVISTIETECEVVILPGMTPQEQNEAIRDTLLHYFDGVYFEGDYIIIPEDADVAGIELETTEPTHTGMDILVGLHVCYPYMPGDVDDSGVVDMDDVTYLVNYFGGGPAPPYQTPDGFYAAADANGSCAVNSADVSYLVAYLQGGPPPTFCPLYLPCSQSGACCWSEGLCTTESQANCENNGGTFYPEQSCDEVDCPVEVTGACCVDNMCVDTMTEEDCYDLGGAWYTGETCPEFECPLPAIPTLHEWGMIILGLLLLSAGTVAVIWRRRAALARTN